jgi:uncharacterized protein (DUF885 family)
MRKCGIPALAALALAGCSAPEAPPDLPHLAEEFVYSTLAFSPVAATAAGYHRHGADDLDQMMDDFSPAAIENQRAFYQTFHKRLARIDRSELAPQDAADLDVMSGQIALAQLELDQIQSYRHNPTVYVELAGNALFSPFVLQYAPEDQRFGDLIARLKRVPGFLEQAKQNLADSPRIWRTVAMQENDGNVDLIDKEIRGAAPPALRGDYDAAAGPALAALRGFNEWLRTDLSRRESSWRLGPQRYAAKFRWAMGAERSPAQVLADAETDLAATRTEMLALAAPPGRRARVNPNSVIARALDKIARRHATPETYLAEAREDLAEARAFVRGHALLALPARDNLEVIETPVFMRGAYAVGGFSPAPALEPHLGAFYWITPIPKSWSRERVESKLREYNFYKLKLLTLHEAIPGHYVQEEYANDVHPVARRILRAVYGNVPYVEGWAQYATEMALDEGFGDHSPELRLTFLKERLRVLANAILDIRLHTLDMTDQQALALMENQTFQEPEEAEAKLQRAKLSACQLPAYYIGWRGWVLVRDEARRARGDKFRLAAFNQRALKQGAVPLPVLARLLAAGR